MYHAIAHPHFIAQKLNVCQLKALTVRIRNLALDLRYLPSFASYGIKRVRVGEPNRTRLEKIEKRKLLVIFLRLIK